MKIAQSLPVCSAEFDIENAVPDDFPVSDNVLDLMEQAEAMLPIETDGFEITVAHFRRLHLERFEECRDLAMRLCVVVQDNEQAALSARSKSFVLDGYRNVLSRTGWTTVEEAYWITHRMALWLGWSNTSPQSGKWIN